MSFKIMVRHEGGEIFTAFTWVGEAQRGKDRALNEGAKFGLPSIVEVWAVDTKDFREAIASNVEFYFTDVDEIGSSDLNACVRGVLSDIGVPDNLTIAEFMEIKLQVREQLSERSR